MRLVSAFILFTILLPGQARSQNGALVLQTDFGLKDGAVAAMKGVAYSVAIGSATGSITGLATETAFPTPRFQIFDLTHEIPAFNTWEAAYRLWQAISYWPAGTVFVSVVDPGVGSDRKSVVAKTRSGHFIVTPDNGTLTMVARVIGIDSLRQIDEKINRLPGSAASYTFHGRDVYAYTGARLAGGIIRFSEVGPALSPEVVMIPFREAGFEAGYFHGSIPVLDEQYGNVWTNIPLSLLEENGVRVGDRLELQVSKGSQILYRGVMIFGNTFSAVREGEPVAYANSLLNLSFGINMGNLAERYKLSSGPEWQVRVRKL
ncbi:hypothetical protein BC349_08435 [Flavihumibacter stibioxidans]|uniref:DNA-directed RNA polymerase subunit delta n=1 Tax=Flavihumibacter stibioxidans TaxID=1834163 RepID=A0ABR7M7Q7_9BACT|nr:hypothetical protein [Flavihumibacter stibioxidans]